MRAIQVFDQCQSTKVVQIQVAQCLLDGDQKLRRHCEHQVLRLADELVQLLLDAPGAHRRMRQSLQHFDAFLTRHQNQNLSH